MQRTVILVLAGLLPVAACGGGAETGLKAFDDAEPAYSPNRAKIICESRAEEAALRAAQRAHTTLQEGDWGTSGMSYAIEDVKKRIRRSRLRGCLAEFGYYFAEEDR